MKKYRITKRIIKGTRGNEVSVYEITQKWLLWWIPLEVKFTDLEEARRHVWNILMELESRKTVKVVEEWWEETYSREPRRTSKRVK